MELSQQYAIGFFDADGTIVYHSSAIEVHVTQCRTDVLDAFTLTYGGSIVVQRRGVIATERQNGVRRQVYRWRLVGYDAAQFLRDALPFLIVKRERAVAALDKWERHLASRSRNRMPNRYYEECKSEGREVSLIRMNAEQRKREMSRRAEWLSDRGWD